MMISRLQPWLQRMLQKRMKIKDKIRGSILRLPENQLLSVLALVVGVCSGFAAVLLKQGVYFIQWLLTSWFNTQEDSLWFLLYPGIGMLIALLLVRYVIKDNIGHGVTKVLLAVSKNDSKIKPHNTWSSILTSSFTIGFGGSVGAEAPIVYTGAAIGSNIGRYFNLSFKDITILLGCGAAGAVAGIFKAPLAGVLFTLEILLFNMSMSSILPFVISAITACCVSYFFLGDAVAFENAITPFKFGNTPYYIVFGILCGFASLYFTRVTIFLEDKIKLITNIFERWAICAVCLGLLIFLFPPLYGEGYTTLTALLNENSSEAVGHSIFTGLFDNPWFFLLFFVAVFFFKVFSMTLTNAGGGVGGTFGPTLVIGGLFGFVVVRFATLCGIGSLPEANLVLVGMAGLMSGVMQAPLTAIFLIAEITGGYDLIMPLIIVSAVSFATIRIFEPYSIYTKRIAKSGELLTHDSDHTVLTLMKVGNVVEKDFSTVKIDATLGELVSVIAKSKRNLFPILDNRGVFQGSVLLDDVRGVMFESSEYERLRVYNFLKPSPALCYEDESMEDIMAKFEKTGAWNLPVVSREKKYLGFVSKSQIFSAYREQLKQVSHD